MFMKESNQEVNKIYIYGSRRSGRGPATNTPHTAAHKISGFASHSANYFCHCCWITQNDLKKNPRAFDREGTNLINIAYLNSVIFLGFRPRTNAEHCQRGEEYAKLQSDYTRQQFVTKHASRYTELSRLPYFDLVRMTVIDPMHNLFLGTCNTRPFNSLTLSTTTFVQVSSRHTSTQFGFKTKLYTKSMSFANFTLSSTV